MEQDGKEADAQKQMGREHVVLPWPFDKALACTVAPRWHHGGTYGGTYGGTCIFTHFLLRSIELFIF